MGIGSFFKWFSRRFGTHIHKLAKEDSLEDLITIHYGEDSFRIHNLLIDMNGLFHKAAQMVYRYGSYAVPVSLLRPQQFERVTNPPPVERVFAKVCELVENILYIVRPTKRLVLCVDGSAPKAKMKQQRQRRFKASSDRVVGFTSLSSMTGNTQSSSQIRFDINSITAGTEFTDCLTNYIERFIYNKIRNEPIDSVWKELEVVFSSEKVAGEGESKIFQYLRKYGNPSENSCVQGMDADIIMLSLGCDSSNMFILRDDMYSRDSDYTFINIRDIKPSLVSLMNWNLSTTPHLNVSKDAPDASNSSRLNDDSLCSESPDENSPFIEKLAVRDFIFVCFMCGNDFLPLIQSIEIVNDGIEKIIKIYKKACITHGHMTSIGENGLARFNKTVLYEFFRILELKEGKYMNEKIANKSSYHPDLLLEESTVICDDGTILDIDNYRLRYTSKHFPIIRDNKCGVLHPTPPPPTVPKKGRRKQVASLPTPIVDASIDACNKYLEGLQWTLGYYLDGVKSWTWYYPYHYSPTVSLLKQVVTDYEFSNHKRTDPVTPYEQLLCVLPPESVHLIPEPLHHIMLSPDSPLRKYIPLVVEVDRSGKHNDWEVVVLIPMVDFQDIKDVYNSSLPLLNQRDIDRNQPQQSKTFKFDSKNRNGICVRMIDL